VLQEDENVLCFLKPPFEQFFLQGEGAAVGEETGPQGAKTALSGGGWGNGLAAVAHPSGQSSQWMQATGQASIASCILSSSAPDGS
jgi:hypothetical protein